MTAGMLSVLLAQTAVEISWGTSLLEQKIILSDGTSVDPSTLTIELGSFDDSFTPDHTNMGEWLSKWRVFDAITDSDSSVATTDPDAADSFTNVSGGTDDARFAGMAHLLGDGTSDSEDAAPGYTWSAGEQGYLFIRSSDLFISSSEWLLVTSKTGAQHEGDNPWLFPSVNEGQEQFPLAWWAPDADKAVFGGVGGTAGPGGYTDTSNDYLLRLHTIPEPTSTSLILASALVLAARRRRISCP